MNISIRNAEFLDIGKIVQIFGVNTYGIKELINYRDDYYDKNGNRLRVHTGFPDSVWIAEIDGNFAGYLHFYCDCHDGYEYVEVSLNTDPSLSQIDTKSVRDKLKDDLKHLEP